MTRILALSGIAGPLLFTAIVVICALMRPDFSHSSQFISELGATGTQNASLMNYAGFMASGALVFLSGLGLLGRFRGGVLAIAGALLVAVFGAGIFLAGVYSCDPGCRPADPSAEQVRHDLVSIIAFLSMIVGVALWGFRLRSLPAWRGFARYSLVTAAVAAAILAAMIVVPAIVPVLGVAQRLFLTVLFVWLMAISARSLRESRPRSGS